MSEQPTQGQPSQPQPQQMQVQVREDKLHSCYANQSVLRGGPQAEELVVDFAMMMPDPARQDAMVMDVQSRVYMSFFAAKRLALQLSQAVQRYEQQFGPIELDPRRRLRQGS